jgi:hypothetical protein
MNGHHCLNCQKPITWRFAICSDCEKIYGSSPKQWPEWLRFLWNDIQKERRRHVRVNKYETSFVDLEEESDDDYE